MPDTCPAANTFNAMTAAIMKDMLGKQNHRVVFSDRLDISTGQWPLYICSAIAARQPAHSQRSKAEAWPRTSTATIQSWARERSRVQARPSIRGRGALPRPCRRLRWPVETTEATPPCARRKRRSMTRQGQLHNMPAQRQIQELAIGTSTTRLRSAKSRRSSTSVAAINCLKLARAPSVKCLTFGRAILFRGAASSTCAGRARSKLSASL